MKRVAASAFLAVLVGVAVGYWTRELMVPYRCTSLACPAFDAFPRFATWQCVTFGAAAASVVLLAAWALNRRWPSHPIPREARPAV